MERILSNPIVNNQEQSQLNKKLNNFLRRMLDCVASFSGLVLLSPLFLLITIAIKSDSPGPVFFKGKRMGRNGKPFEILKFRTMVENPESYRGPKVTAQDDPRITGMGKWLRDTKLNELPQLINILRGEMSLVGPRPEDVDIANTWTDEQKDVLLSVRPGLTSPASVVYRNEEELLSHADGLGLYLNEILPDKMRLDMLYVLQRNFLSDLDVIFCTLTALLPGWRKSDLKQWELYYGPLTRFINRYLMWFTLDLFFAFLSFTATSIIYRLNAPLNIGWNVAILYLLIFSFVNSITNLALNLYNVEWSRAPSRYAIHLTFSTVVGMLVVDATQLIFRDTLQELPFIVVVVTTLLTSGFAILIRYRERLITTIASRWLKLRGGVHEISENVLIVGAGRNATATEWLFNQSVTAQWFRIVGMVDDQARMQKMRIGYSHVLGTTEQIPEIVKNHNIGLICYAIQNISDADQDRIFQLCRNTDVRVVEMPDFFGILGNAFQQAETEKVKQN